MDVEDGVTRGAYPTPTRVELDAGVDVIVDVDVDVDVIVIVIVDVIAPVIVAALVNGNANVGVIAPRGRSGIAELGQHRHDPLSNSAPRARVMVGVPPDMRRSRASITPTFAFPFTSAATITGAITSTITITITTTTTTTTTTT